MAGADRRSLDRPGVAARFPRAPRSAPRLRRRGPRSGRAAAGDGDAGRAAAGQDGGGGSGRGRRRRRRWSSSTAGSSTARRGRRASPQAASEERERRAQAGKPVAVIDNRNLAEFSQRAEADGRRGRRRDGDGGVHGQGRRRGRRERHPRRGLLAGARASRSGAAGAKPPIGSTELEGKSEELRRQFYAADDPYKRDSQIKPEWDHALDELDSKRREVERARSSSSSAT